MFCADCKDVYGSAISQDVVDIADLHEFEVKGLMGEPCSRCGSPYAERHHYMPQSLARQAGVNPEEWATGYLCKECHEIWHAIVTPGLVPYKAQPRRWEAPKPDKVR